MITANTSARLQAAQQLVEAVKLVQRSRALICFGEPIHTAKFDTILRELESLINEAMKAGG